MYNILIGISGLDFLSKADSRYIWITLFQ